MIYILSQCEAEVKSKAEECGEWRVESENEQLRSGFPQLLLILIVIDQSA